MSEVFDVAILGLGAMGAFALQKAANDGLKAIGIDRYVPPHSRGSSHGETRLIREAYAEGAKYVPLVRRSIELWREFDNLSTDKVFHQTGVRFIGRNDDAHIRNIYDSAEKYKIHLERNDQKDAVNRALQVPPGWDDLTERNGGYLWVELAIKRALQRAAESGAQLTYNCAAKKIKQLSDGYGVETCRGEIKTRSVIVSAGPWTEELLPFLAPYLALERHVVHWFEDITNQHSLDGGFIPFVVHGENEVYFYGFPANDHGLVKIGDHTKGVRFSGPEKIDKNIDTDEISHILKLKEKFLPSLGGLVKSSVCIYTMTLDEDFIVDRHPEYERVFFVAGLSGHGFKFAPGMAEALLQMTMGDEPAIDMSAFKLKRFET